MKLLTISVIAVFFSSSARAGYYCADPKVVESKLEEDCSNNEYVSEAAVQCLEKLEAEIDAARKLVTTAATAHAEEARRTQEGHEVNAGADYKFSMATLDVLLQHAEQAEKEIVFLDKNVLAMPEDYDEPEITGMDRETYLKSTACFADNRAVIANVLLDFDKHMSDLQFARDSAGNLNNGTQKNAAGLGGGGPKNAKGQGSGQAAAKPRKPKKGASTITGVEEDKSKQGK